MFRGASNFVGKGLSHWNVSHIHRANYMFEGAVSFTEDISRWGECVWQKQQYRQQPS
jgi:hypothetical protein